MDHDLHILHCTYVSAPSKSTNHRDILAQRENGQEEARKALLICTHYFQQASICHEDMSASARRLVDCRFSWQACDTPCFIDSIDGDVGRFYVAETVWKP